MKTNRISIIVPVYNVEKYLQKCVDSILAQTFTDFELLLVDDGTPDEGAGICDENALKCKKTITIHKKNGGQAEARNYALDVVRSEYIGFVDSDDSIVNTMYEHLFADASDYDTIVMCGRNDVDSLGVKMGECFTFDEAQVWNKKETVKRFLTWNGIDSSSCDKLFSRKLIGDIRYPIGYICEDIPFVFSILKKAKQVINIGEPLYNYLYRPGSTSRQKEISQKVEGFVKYNREILQKIKQSDMDLIEEAEFFYLHMALYYHHFLIQNNYYGKFYKNNRRGIIAEKRYINQNPYFKDYEKKELKRIASFYYPIYRLIKNFLK